MTRGRRASGPRVLGVMLVASLSLGACGSAADDADSGSRGPARTTEQEPAPTTTTTTTSLPPGGRQPDGGDPLRVLFAGDSLAEEVAAPTTAALNGGGAAEAGFVARPALPREPDDLLAWQARLAEVDPDVVVVLVGVWERMVFRQAQLEGQSLTQYRDEVVDPFVDTVANAGAELVWVSSPLVREPTARAQLAFMNGIFEGVGAVDDRVDYVDAAARIIGPDGGHVEMVTGPDGFTERVGRLDGTHLCPGGAVRMAEPVVGLLVDRWNVPVDEDWPNGAWRGAVPFEQAAAECPAVV